MAAILRDSTVVVAVVVMRTRQRAIPLAMITMRKSTHGFSFASHKSMGLRLAALWAAGAPLKSTLRFLKGCSYELLSFHTHLLGPGGTVYIGFRTVYKRVTSGFDARKHLLLYLISL